MDPPDPNTTVRLTGSTLPYSGRVEVNIGGEWGVVCHEGWDDNDADVVCNQWGYDAGHLATLRGSMFIEVFDLPIWMTDVRCSRDPTLQDCPHKPRPPALGRSYCPDNETAAVVCGNVCVYGQDASDRYLICVSHSSIREFDGECYRYLYVIDRFE
jgi:hypothetical protein